VWQLIILESKRRLCASLPGKTPFATLTLKEKPMSKTDLPWEGTQSVRISLEGLGMCDLNPDNPANLGGARGEIVALRAPKHVCTISIKDETTGEAVLDDQDNSHDLENGVALPESAKLVIRADKADLTHPQQHKNGFQDGKPFDRRGNGNHEKDYRWVLDATTIASDQRFPQAQEMLGLPPFPLTFGYIYDAVFYTQDRTNEVLMLPLEQDPNLVAKHVSAPFIIGKANERIGADIILLAGGTVYVKILNMDNTVARSWTLPQGKKYAIELVNNERPDWLPDDFHFFHQVLGLSPRYELWSNCPGGGQRSSGCQCGFCGGGGKIKALAGYDDKHNLRNY
jgi:hypothetical protein